MKSSCVAALGILVSSAPVLAQGWDLSTDWSTTQNPNGVWTHGESPITTESVSSSDKKECTVVHHVAGPHRKTAMQAMGNLPLSFEANKGQAPGDFSHVASSPGYQLFFSPSETLILFERDVQGVAGPREAAAQDGDSNFARDRVGLSHAALRLKLLGARAATLQGIEELPAKVSYFVGKDPEQWRTGIPTYSRLRSTDVYPGIDVEYYGNAKQLEFDFIIGAGVDPGAIALTIEGAESLQVSERGELVASAYGEELRFRAPIGYQEWDGRRLPVEVTYTLNDDQRVAFRIGAYDTTHPLIIDPVLAYSTYLGSSQDIGITVDDDGNVYVTGYKGIGFVPGSVHFGPGGGGAYVSVTKLNPCGTAILYAATVGGSFPTSPPGKGYSIAVDADHNAYVAGGTPSHNFPITAGAFDETFNGGQTDGFVFKLNPSGTALVYSTYLGGTGDERAWGIAVHSSGVAVVTGDTDSADFPVYNASQSTYAGNQDAFVTALNPDGAGFVYSTFLGGGSAENGRGIALDASLNAYVSGRTGSVDFPMAGVGVDTTKAGTTDAFVTKLDATSALIYSTYLGGSGAEGDIYGAAGDNTQGLYSRITVDEAGYAYVAGETRSADFPTTSGAHGTSLRGFSDCYITKLPPSGSTAYVFSTYLGGSGFEICRAIAVDASGNVYVTGDTGSTDFPTLDAFQSTSGGGNIDAFVTELHASGTSLVYSSYLGGSSDEYGLGIALNNVGNAHVAGTTSSNNFPTVNSLVPGFPGASNAFVVKVGVGPDGDADTVEDLCDNCPSTPNASQQDSDTDSFGDACDNCPDIFNPDQAESEGIAANDGVGDVCDNCPFETNPLQEDCDDNGVGDACQYCGPCQLHGDIVDVEAQPFPDCNIDVSDLLCILDDFVGQSPCAGDTDIISADFSCVPDGIVDSSDILCMVDAFAGNYCCPAPCPIGGCIADWDNNPNTPDQCRDELSTALGGGLSEQECCTETGNSGFFCGTGVRCGDPGCP